MGWLSRKLEEKRLRLLAAARRGAFESYMPHGRVPEAYERIAAVVSEAKALNADVSLEALGRPAGRPSTHYVWRTAGDGRVRGSRVARLRTDTTRGKLEPGQDLFSLPIGA